MAGTVASLLKTTPQQNASKAATSNRGEDAGEEFKAELGRAKKRQSDKADDQSPAPKKAEKTSSARKPNAKDKSHKSADQDSTVAADAQVNDTAFEKPDPTPTVDDLATDVAPDLAADTKTPADTTVPKDKSAQVDVSTAALSIAVPTQLASADTAEKSEADSGQTAGSVVNSVTPTETTLASAVTKQATSDTTTAQFTDEQKVAADPNTAGEVVEKSQSRDPIASSIGDDAEVAIQPRESRAKSPTAGLSTDAAAVDAAQTQVASELPEADSDKPHAEKPSDTESPQSVLQNLSDKPTAAASAQVVKAEQPQSPPEARFAEVNHAEIVKGIQTELVPCGGTIQIRLDPPELGALQVILTVKDGVINATFQTSNEDSSRLLSHSLGQLKTALESAGVTVDKLQVTHTPRDTQTNAGGDDQRHQPGQDDMSRQQEQQRKEMIKRMWRKLAGENNPLDLVA